MMTSRHTGIRYLGYEKHNKMYHGTLSAVAAHMSSRMPYRTGPLRSSLDYS
jgi:hypothetical protein